MPSATATTPHQAARKEQILTQPVPSKVRQSTHAVILKHESLFMLTDPGGDIPFGGGNGLGVFFRDCRFLDGYELTIDGAPLVVLTSDDSQGFETWHQLTNNDLSRQNPPVPKDTLSITRRRAVRRQVVQERITLHNYGPRHASFSVELRFGAQFEDLFILKGFLADPRGTVHDPDVGQGVVRLQYTGVDHKERSTEISFEPSPDDLTHERARFDVRLSPGESRDIGVAIAVHVGHPRSAAMTRAKKDAASATHWQRRSESIWLGSSTEVRASNPLFDRVFQRALLDLRTLRSTMRGKHFFAAGVPWFVTLFGRDACIAALQTLPYGSITARDTLELLASFQAHHRDQYRDAEPGKILHEYRSGELASADEIPQSPAYYGTVDATLLFIILLGEYVNWTGDAGLAKQLRPNLEAALDWIDRFADHDGDGYVDYVGEFAGGLVNQGWKDSGNAIVNADGTLCQPPIALCEVQGYVYRAWRQAADLLRTLGDSARARDLDAQADDLRQRFERDFWDEGLGCYVLARQKGGRPARVVSSNAGQVLWSGIAGADHAARVATRLMQDDMFSGWGIRTLSNHEKRFNPGSYHLGSVWPHDNAIILAGFARYGQDDRALTVFDGLFDAATALSAYRLPELFCGFARQATDSRPVPYPVACRPQAWAAGALPHALWNLLGLDADAPHGRLHVVHPRLPAWLDWIELRRMPVGRAEVSMKFRRQPDGRVTFDASVAKGNLSIDAERAP